MRSLPIIISFCVLSTNCRLIEKNTERNDVTKPTESLSPVRVSRQAFYDDGIGISREESLLPLDEYPQAYVRKGRYSLRSSQFSDEVISISPRVNRGSGEKRIETSKPAEHTEEQSKTAKVLIKKPIPKFNYIEYDEFQVKVNKAPEKFTDSGEHEDEDFNLDDYEFDVGHDEFIGRGKPLEPRTKPKENKAAAEKKIPKAKPIPMPPPEIKTMSKVVIPEVHPPNVKRNANTKKGAYKMKEDYYDDVVTTTRAPVTEVKRDLDDESTDDSEEYTRKTSVRNARGLLNVKTLADKIGGQSAATALAKILERIPLFGEEPRYDGFIDELRPSRSRP